MTQQRPHDSDVAVVGAGPVGLCLALNLARRGHTVTVLEQTGGPVRHSRAPALWPATQEVLASLGVIDGFFAEGLSLPRLELWDADRHRVLFSAPLEELAGETAFPQLLILPQSRTESLLLEALRGQSRARVLFDHEVTGLRQDEDGVRLGYLDADGRRGELHARFAAGCDGAHSTIRECLGADFHGTTYGMRAGLADVEIESDLDLRFPRLTTQPRLAIGIRMGERLWRLILPCAETEELAVERRAEDAARGLFPGGHRLVWQSEFRLHRRLSSLFQAGRVALAGDAAHLNSPVGGQGMNAGIKDSVLLCEALAAALQSDNEAPLASYARQRRRAVRRGVNRFTHLLTRVLLLRRGRLLRALLPLAAMVLRVRPLRRRFLRRLAMLEPPAQGAR